MGRKLLGSGSKVHWEAGPWIGSRPEAGRKSVGGAWAPVVGRKFGRKLVGSWSEVGAGPRVGNSEVGPEFAPGGRPMGRKLLGSWTEARRKASDGLDVSRKWSGVGRKCVGRRARGPEVARKFLGSARRGAGPWRIKARQRHTAQH